MPHYCKMAAKAPDIVPPQNHCQRYKDVDFHIIVLFYHIYYILPGIPPDPQQSSYLV